MSRIALVLVWVGCSGTSSSTQRGQSSGVVVELEQPWTVHVDATQAALDSAVDAQLQARQTSDVVRFSCVNDRLLPLKVMRNRLDSLVAERSEADDSTRPHIDDQIRVIASRANKLAQEARVCLSNDIVPVGPSKDE